MSGVRPQSKGVPEKGAFDEAFIVQMRDIFVT